MSTSTTNSHMTLAKSTPDSRRVPRKPRVREITIYDSPEAFAGEQARLADVSTFGLGFVQSNPMTVGQQFVLRLEMEEGVVMPLLFRVAYCRPISATAFRIGAALVRVINGDESIEINAATDEGIEFAEAFAEIVSGQSLVSSYKMPVAPSDDDFSWAILVDSQEFAELVALSEKTRRRTRPQAGRGVSEPATM
jgi:hypothetical protein